jgi:hypothetical protein
MNIKYTERSCIPMLVVLAAGIGLLLTPLGPVNSQLEGGLSITSNGQDGQDGLDGDGRDGVARDGADGADGADGSNSVFIIEVPP